MKILLQRVSQASVRVDDKVIGSIDRGLLLFVGVMKGDTEIDATKLMEKILKLRIFEGDEGKHNNRSVVDIGGGILVVSQFTLAGDVSKGSRPDYTAAESPERAQELYQFCIQTLKQKGAKKVESGEFGAHMQVKILNDGPVTLLLES